MFLSSVDLQNSIASPSVTKQTCHLFVYGTLRPDDCYSGAHWTVSFNRNTVARPGFVRHARLFYSRFPFIIIDPQRFETTDTVRGYVLTTSNALEWELKLREADEIEGYPEYYNRMLVNAFLLSSLEDSMPAAAACLQCWVYFNPHESIDASIHIPSGDWSQWIRVKENRAIHSGHAKT